MKALSWLAHCTAIASHHHAPWVCASVCLCMWVSAGGSEAKRSDKRWNSIELCQMCTREGGEASMTRGGGTPPETEAAFETVIFLCFKCVTCLLTTYVTDTRRILLIMLLKWLTKKIHIVNPDSEHTTWRANKSRMPAVVCKRVSSEMFPYKKISL